MPVPISGAPVVGSQAPSFNFPVVIGEGSHPFPFRTRKLSSLPPMVLRGKLRGRVGHCRDYLAQKGRRISDGLFLCHWRTPNDADPPAGCQSADLFTRNVEIRPSRGVA